MSKASKKTPIIKKKCSIKKLAEQYDLDASDYEELLKRIKLDIRRHKKIIKSKKSTKKDIEDSKRKLEGLLCSQAVLKERIYEEAGVSTETIGKPKTASEEQKLINFLLSKAVKEPAKEIVKDKAEKKVEKLTPLTKADFYKKNTKDQKKDLDEALNKMEEIKKTITQKVIVTPVEKEELKLIKKEIAEVGSVRSSLNDPTVKVVPAVPTTSAPVSIKGKSEEKYSKKKKEIKDLKARLDELVKNSSKKEKELEQYYLKLKEDYDKKNKELRGLNSETENFIQQLFAFENRIISLYDNPTVSQIINTDEYLTPKYNELIELSNQLNTSSGDIAINIKNKMQKINRGLLKEINRQLNSNEHGELKNEITEIQESLDPLKNKKQKYRERSDILVTEIMTIREALDKTKSTLESTINEKERLESNIINMQNELDKFKESKTKLEEVNKKISDDVEFLGKERNELMQEIEELKQNIEDPMEAYLDIAQLDEKERLTNTLREKEEELNRKNIEYNKLSNEYNKIQNLKEELTKEFKNTISTFNDLAKYTQDLNREYDKVIQTNQNIQQLNEQYTTELKNKHDELEKERGKIFNREQILDSIKDNFNDMQVQLKEAEFRKSTYYKKLKESEDIKTQASDKKKVFLQQAAIKLKLPKEKATKKDIEKSSNDELIKEYQKILNEFDLAKKLVDDAEVEDKQYEDIIESLHTKISDIKLEIIDKENEIDKLFRNDANIQIEQVKKVEKLEDDIENKVNEIEEKLEQKEENVKAVEEEDEDEYIFIEKPEHVQEEEGFIIAGDEDEDFDDDEDEDEPKPKPEQVQPKPIEQQAHIGRVKM